MCCRSSPAAYWSGQPGTLLATIPPEPRWTPGHRRAATAAGESPLFESIAPDWSAGRRIPLVRGGRHCRLWPRRKRREPHPQRLPRHARPMSAAPERGPAGSRTSVS